MKRLDPSPNCRRCPRLVAYRRENRARYPEFHNAPATLWGEPEARLLIVGLAPGLKGANRTGRPFTGDASGALLFAALVKSGLALRTHDDILLYQCAITNAVACVPPENRPTGAELAACRPFLANKLHHGPRAVLALGRVAHESVLRAMNARVSDHPFAHGSDYRLGDLRLISSYHPSRYNVATKRIDFEMLFTVVSACAAAIADS